jgi:hypothetical protein
MRIFKALSEHYKEGWRSDADVLLDEERVP